MHGRVPVPIEKKENEVPLRGFAEREKNSSPSAIS